MQATPSRLLSIKALPQVESASLQQRPVKQAAARPKRSGKQGDGSSKQSVERKRQADVALDQLAARAPSSTSGICSVYPVLISTLTEGNSALLAA